MATIKFIIKAAKGFLLTATLVSTIIACKKDKDNIPDPNPDPGNSVQRLKEFKHGDDLVRFEYNNEGKVNKLTLNDEVFTGGTPTAYTVSYQGDKISAVTVGQEKIELVYENNTLKRADIINEGVRIGYTAYEFQNGQLKRATAYFGEAPNFVPLFEYIFDYNAAGNIEEVLAMVASGENMLKRAGHVKYEYDDKTNPLYAHRDLLAIFWQPISKNNIRVENHFDSDLEPEDKYVYNYQYNAKGLPKKAMVTRGLPGQAQTAYEVNFVYQ